MRKSQNQSTRKALHDLIKMRSTFGPAAAGKKMSLLRKLRKTPIGTPSELLKYHDLLCVLRAYPDNARILALAERELQSFSARIEHYRQTSRDRQGRRLADSGLVNTVTTHPYCYEMTRQLLQRHSRDLVCEWDEEDETTAGKLNALLPFVIAWQEIDALDYDDFFDLRTWLTLSQGKRRRNDLRSFVGLLNGSRLPGPIKKQFYDNLDLPIKWTLTNSSASRTLKRLPSGRKFYQKEPLIRRASDLRAELVRPASPLRLLSRRDGEKHIRAANEVLAVRNRELFPLTFANPGEVYLCEPGRGLRIFVYGMEPSMRLPLESNYGALLVRNGMPVGYGVAATLFDRVEIAINIFPAFRSGESSFAIEQFFRLFYHHFGSRLFLVRSTQMGEDEEEALHSGAFWFYYKLGFRAINKRVRRLAEREYAKIRQRPGYRTPLKQMKRLAKTDVCLHAHHEISDEWQELSIVNLGYLITRYFAEKFDGNRRKGVNQSVAYVAGTLGIRNIERWPPDMIVALERLAPLVACIPGLAKWTKGDKEKLVRIIRSKGGRLERSFVLHSIRHRRFREAVERLAD